MRVTRDVLVVAMEAGEKVWVHSRGNPAVLLAGAVVVAATAIGYGSVKYGDQLLKSLGWE